MIGNIINASGQEKVNPYQMTFTAKVYKKCLKCKK